MNVKRGAGHFFCCTVLMCQTFTSCLPTLPLTQNINVVQSEVSGKLLRLQLSNDVNRVRVAAILKELLIVPKYLCPSYELKNKVVFF